MSETGEIAASRLVAICAGPQGTPCDQLVRDLCQLAGDDLTVVRCLTVDEALSVLADAYAQGDHVPLLFAWTLGPVEPACDLLMAIHGCIEYQRTNKVLAAESCTSEPLVRALKSGAVDRYLTVPWTRELLAAVVTPLLLGYLKHHVPPALPQFAHLDRRGQTPARRDGVLASACDMTSQELRTLQRSFLADVGLSDEQVEAAMIGGIDHALGTPDRKTYEAGAVLIKQGDPVDTISILVDGYIQLSRKASERDIVLHTHSAGRVIGLLGISHRQRAFYTCTALTDVTVIPLTIEQLDTALQADPWLSLHFVTVLIRSLVTRSKRTAELKMEIEDLNTQLRAERDQLTSTLTSLKDAQMALVQSEKMATLGQMAAGMAHELNNPTAAIRRSVEFIAEDVLELVARLPDGDAYKAVMLAALTDTPLSTRELRQRRSALAPVVGDDAMAQRLVKIGITTAEQFKRQLGKVPAGKRDAVVREMQQFHTLGVSIRNITSCSDRVSAIVKSLRSYVRHEEGPVGGVDLNEGIEDTIRLFGHALAGVEVKRSYGDLPRIECHVGELNQVWTNLISNALDAMERKGKLQVITDALGGDQVRVRVIDSGPGIPPDALERIFDLRFTTKDGRVEFGLGMGLPICQQIVSRHGGHMDVQSRPGETCVTVVLPKATVHASETI